MDRILLPYTLYITFDNRAVWPNYRRTFGNIYFTQIYLNLAALRLAAITCRIQVILK